MTAFAFCIDKPSYVIEGSHNEFCSIHYVFNAILGLLDQYDKHEINGIAVRYEHNGFCFDTERGPNWWLYYFEPLSHMHATTDVWQRVPNYMKFIKGTETLFEMSRERKHELISRYIHVNQEMNDKVDVIIEHQYVNSFVIGLDYIRTSLPACNPNVTFEQISNAIQQVIANLPDQTPYKIFLVTNDRACLDYMQQAFPDNVIYSRVASRKDTAACAAELWLLNGLLLSRTNVFITCGSLLSKSALAFNLDVPIIELDIHWAEKE